ncbi:MAG: phospholipase D-like domain-containing protein [Kiritimatiellia bacterium]|jgi:phosphatidylserine/phosphatidylglycerophosphate/cardiolipin synthase-like enzyme|nr:phospholipase D-like domain-containing protein [Kiritimatiellia bacterium]
MIVALAVSPCANGQGFKEWLEKDKAEANTFDGPAKTPEVTAPDKEPAPSSTPKPSPKPKASPALRQPIERRRPAHKPISRVSPLHPFVKRAVLGLHEGKEASESNYVCVINSGINALILRLHLIRNAQKSIDVQTFIFNDDEVGRLFAYEFIQAAKRGVKVRVIADHMVSAHNTDAAAFLATVHPNIEFRHYRPVANRMNPSKLQEIVDGLIPNRTNQRMHNKLFLVDDLLAITGGRNIENSYYDFSTGMNFKDRDVLILGPVAADMKVSFDQFWEYKQSVPSRKLRDVQKAIDKGNFKRPETREEFRLDDRFDTVERLATNHEYIRDVFAKRLVKPTRVVFLADKPGKNRKFFFFSGGGRITEQLGEALQLAESGLVIQSPYLVLDRKMRRLFRGMKKRNKNMRIIISSNSFAATDNTIAYSANYRLRSSYIEDVGAEIYEYKPRPTDLLNVFPQFPEMKARGEAEGAKQAPHLCIHAKTLVIDQQHTFIGTYNLDPRSANLNTEMGLLIDDPVVATWVRNDILRDCLPRNSWVINKRRMPLSLDDVNRLVEGTLRHTPVDIWPIRNTTSFALRKNRPAVPPYHADFYDCYKEAGNFPGACDDLMGKEIMARLLKTITSPVQPLF